VCVCVCVCVCVLDQRVTYHSVIGRGDSVVEKPTHARGKRHADGAAGEREREREREREGRRT